MNLKEKLKDILLALGLVHDKYNGSVTVHFNSGKVQETFESKEVRKIKD